MLRAEAGRSPKRNTAQGNTLGTSVPTIQRAVSATGASEILVRSFLLLFQSANYLIHFCPGRCPGLISYWAFSPSLQRANPLFKIKQQNFKRNEATEVIFLIIATEGHGTTRTCRESSRKLYSLKKIIALSKFVAFVERLRSLNYQQCKIRSFVLFVVKNNCPC